MWNSILASAGILGGLGLLFGVVLGVASKFFGGTVDDKEALVRETLPGANCGACGKPGCDGLAAAIAKGEAPVNACPLCNVEAVAKIADAMGAEPMGVRQVKAVVRCRGTHAAAHDKFEYHGLERCTAAASVDEGYKACRFSCMGFGTCAEVCPVGAISVKEGLAQVDEDKCVACGACLRACPRGLIALVPQNAPVRISCSAPLKGKEVRENCTMGCIACGICAKQCPAGAIRLENDLPVFDYDLCTGCLACVEKCPRKCIVQSGKKEE